MRELMLGQLGSGMLVHLTYLLGMGWVGAYVVARRVERWLLT